MCFVFAVVVALVFFLLFICICCCFCLLLIHTYLLLQHCNMGQVLLLHDRLCCHFNFNFYSVCCNCTHIHTHWYQYVLVFSQTKYWELAGMQLVCIAKFGVFVVLKSRLNFCQYQQNVCGSFSFQYLLRLKRKFAISSFETRFLWKLHQFFLRTHTFLQPHNSDNFFLDIYST